MSEALVKRAQSLPVASMNDMTVIGQLLAQTGMFGTNNPAEGFVIAAMCHQSGMTFIEYMQTYHLIKGKVSKRADAIQADFQRTGGKVKIVQRDADGAVVELEKDGTKFKSACLWKDCLLEPFVYKGGMDDLKKPEAQRVVKENYATPRKRSQMLWARAISDGVRAVDPASVQGAYTPEELEDIDDAPRAAPVPVRIDAADVSSRLGVLTPATVTPTAPAAKTTPQGEPTPFEMIGNAAPLNVDASACPVPGALFGVKWADMPVSHLEAALNLSNPELLPVHRAAIADELQKKMGVK